MKEAKVVVWGEICPVVSNSLWPHGPYSPWNSPGQNTGAGSQFLSPVDLPNPGIESRFPALQAGSLPAEPSGKPKNTGVGSLSFLQRIFLMQESNQGLLALQADSLPTKLSGKPIKDNEMASKEWLGWHPPSVGDVSQQGGARWREVRWGEEGDCLEGQIWLPFQGHPEHFGALVVISRTLLRRWQAFSIMSCPTWLGETEKDSVGLFWVQKPLRAPPFLVCSVDKKWISQSKKEMENFI